MTCDYSVTYSHRHGRGVQGARRPDPRSLLDELFREDGQTLSALEQRLPMTRFGVMKHLRVLEEAGLVVTRRRGREKLHFLNPVPIRLVHDRWVSKYAEPWAAALSGLKTRTGEDHGEGVRDLHQDDARAAVGGDHRPRACGRKYRFGVGVDSDWTPGSRYEASHPSADRRSLVEGENLEVDPPRRLVQSFSALWSDDVKARAPRGSPGRSSRSATPAG